MKFAKNKTATLIALFLVLTVAVTLVALPVATAHYPPWEVPTWAYLSVSPSTVGVNQQVLLVMWLNSYPYTAEGAYGDRWDGYTVDVTKPDGSKETLGPFTSDPVGSYYTSYTPTQVGTYTFVFKFPGDKLTGQPFPPTWNPYSGGYYDVNDTYLASQSDPVYLTVQQEPMPEYEETPLPEGYWTRPIYGANRKWYQVAGNWLGGAAQNVGPTSRFAYGTGPESAHIMWARPYWAGGIMDTRFGDKGYYTGLSYESFWTAPIIINGKLYYNVITPPRYGWYCIDLRTGHEDYFRNTTGPVTELHTGWFDSSGNVGGGALAFGQIYAYDSPNQHGGFPYLWSTGPPPDPIVYTIDSTWMMFDAFTGNYICSINNVPLWITGIPEYYIYPTGVSVYGKDGSILYYGINDIAPYGAPPKYYLQVWNTSRAIWYEPMWFSNEYWMWRPDLNATFDGNNGYSLNVSIPAVQGSILAIREDQYVIGGTAGKNNGTYILQGHLWALSLKPGQEGTLLWNITYTPPQTVVPDVVPAFEVWGGQMVGPTVDPEDGVFLFKEPMTRRRWGFSLATGQKLWGPTEPEGQWNFYDMAESIYDGKLLSYGYSGVLMAYDIKTGKVLWNWTSGTVGFEGYYENTPITLGCIADGKIYLYSTEHSPSMPLRRDAQLWCVNVSDGKLLWKIQHWGSSPAIADGYLVDLNLFDNQIYCYGKGPSATTVTASPEVSVHGSSVLIKGTVTDQSSGAKGTPAIADEDMEAWMEYLYQQRPIPTNAKGVEVTLDTVDPNGNFIHIGTVTSDMSGMFKKMFTPEVPGEYTIIATFAGSKSYGASYAETAIGVDEAAPASPPPTYPQPIDYTMHFVGVGIAIILAVAIVGILLLRKK